MENARSSKETRELPARRETTASGQSILKTFTPEERAIVDDACRFYFSPVQPSKAAAYEELCFRIASGNEVRLPENKTALRVPSITTFRRVLEAAALYGEGPFVPPLHFGTRR